MRRMFNCRQEEKVNAIRACAGEIRFNACEYLINWSKNLEMVENSLINMRTKLFLNYNLEEVSITGQILMETAAERAAKVAKEAASHHKLMHLHISKMGRLIDKQVDRHFITPFRGTFDLNDSKLSRQLTIAMIYDFSMCNGLTDTGVALKKMSDVDEKYSITEPDTLQQIVSDLREGDIESSLDYLEAAQPEEDGNIRTYLHTQLITDNIELGSNNYDKAVKDLRRFKSPFVDDRQKFKHLVGALLVGKPSMIDIRYKYLFDFTNREILTLKMASFFIPYEAPLKNLMRFGMHAMIQLGDLFPVGFAPAAIDDNELPIEIGFHATHSSFTCPILKEQCDAENPPMRLICGHVISKDAINRLTTSIRQQRNSSRLSKFKCPYCPREQLLENTRQVDFLKWCESDYTDEEVQLFQFFN
ncbi:RING-Gid-type domain-containing protein [Caenorhabditis elegans]|nr:RING-Gid-type domain-containing protein [Caenorhabditis elegans]CAG8860262.1 RING-Gid-type domain-containing protein [Caenorhabditis elegans]